MAARRIFALTVDVSTGKVVDLGGGRAWTAEDLILMRGDTCIFRLSFIYSNDNPAAYPFNSGCTFKLGIKDPTAITGATYLAFADHSAFNNLTDWDQASLPNGKLSVRFDTDTAAINTFLSTSGNTPKDVVIEVQVTEAGEKPFTPAHFDGQIRNDVIRGDEGDPLPTTPTYPTADEINLRLGPGIQLVAKGKQVALIKDGVELQTFGAP